MDIFGGSQVPRWLEEATRPRGKELGEALGTGLADLAIALERDPNAPPEASWWNSRKGIQQAMTEVAATERDPLWKQHLGIQLANAGIAAKSKWMDMELEAKRMDVMDATLKAKDKIAAEQATDQEAISNWMAEVGSDPLKIINSQQPTVTTPQARLFVQSAVNKALKSQDYLDYQNINRELDKQLRAVPFDYRGEAMGIMGVKDLAEKQRQTRELLERPEVVEAQKAMTPSKEEMESLRQQNWREREASRLENARILADEAQKRRFDLVEYQSAARRYRSEAEFADKHLNAFIKVVQGTWNPTVDGPMNLQRVTQKARLLLDNIYKSVATPEPKPPTVAPRTAPTAAAAPPATTTNAPAAAANAPSIQFVRDTDPDSPTYGQLVRK